MRNQANRLVYGIGGLVLLFGCEAGPPPSDGDKDPSHNVRNAKADFYGQLRRVDLTYPAFASIAEMENGSEVVVTGVPEAVEEGRTFGGAAGDPGAAHTIVVRFAVDEVLKGEAGQYVYVQFYRSMSDSIASFNAQLPSHSMKLYLRDADSRPARGIVEGQGRGLPQGERLHYLTTPQGMIVDVDGQQTFPLADKVNWL